MRCVWVYFLQIDTGMPQLVCSYACLWIVAQSVVWLYSLGCIGSYWTDFSVWYLEDILVDLSLFLSILSLLTLCFGVCECFCCACVCWWRKRSDHSSSSSSRSHQPPTYPKLSLHAGSCDTSCFVLLWCVVLCCALLCHIVPLCAVLPVI